MLATTLSFVVYVSINMQQYFNKYFCGMFSGGLNVNWLL